MRSSARSDRLDLERGLPTTADDVEALRRAAAAGRYGITERLGFALRGEFVQDNRNYLRWASSTVGLPVDVDVWGFTGTFDYTITDNLVVKAEFRYDNADFVPEGSFGDNNFINGKDCGGAFDSDCYTNDDQWLTGLEVTYRF